MNTPNDYLPILIQIGVAVGFVALTLGVSHLLGPNRKTAKREDNFECGIENQGNARFPVSVKYSCQARAWVHQTVFLNWIEQQVWKPWTQGFLGETTYLLIDDFSGGPQSWQLCRCH